MKAVIELDVAEWQIGQDVTIYFPDMMMKYGKCELLKEQEAKAGTWQWKIHGKADSGGTLGEAICDQCGKSTYATAVKGDLNYCPNCGAKMTDRWARGKENRRMTEAEKLLARIGTARDAISRKPDQTSLDYMIEGVLMECSVMLEEQEKKQITLHKKHTITWRRNDEFSMRKLYEAICETLLDEGELFIARTDDHEKVDFVFYVAEGR